MAWVRQDWHRRIAAGLLLTLAIAFVPAAIAMADEPSGLYEQPILVVDPGMHTAMIDRADTDAAGRFAVTGSEDKTVRVWSLEPPGLLTTIRLPTGPADVGKVYAVAMSPDGKLVAAGGWTRWTEQDRQEQIYLFSRSGAVIKRIDGLPDVVNHLVFSGDGRYLAAGLSGANGIRIYDGTRNWAEAARDENYKDDVYGLDFAGDGRLATTSDDGHVRLYDRQFVKVKEFETPAGSQPYDVALSPDGRRLAVGLNDQPQVLLLDGATLQPLASPDTGGIDKGDLSSVAWSRDGGTLFAGGQFDLNGKYPLVAWADGGRGERRFIHSGATDTIMSLKSLPGGGILVAAADPHLAIVAADDRVAWAEASPKFDPRGQASRLSVSADGMMVDFGYELWGKRLAQFDVRGLTLIADRPSDGATAPPRQDGLAIDSWNDSPSPTLNGAGLGLEQYEWSRSLAIDPAVKRFVLGTEWSLRAYDSDGQMLWQRAVPGVAWAVNITGDGRMVIAAYDDGTIRWHRMDDGQELLAFMPLSNRIDWVAWTPEGFYGSSPAARKVLNWQVNHGWDAAPELFPLSKFPKLKRPNALHLVLQELETARALGIDDLREGREEVQHVTGSKVPPGARLFLLAIGVGTYGEYAKHLKLDYAGDDARDVKNALSSSQDGLYSQVLWQTLIDEQANHDDILRALGSIRRQMKYGEGNDLAVIMYSGHGALLGDNGNREFYLLPYDVDTRTDPILHDLSISEFKKELSGLAAHGHVLVLLDACRSGGAMDDGTPFSVNGVDLSEPLKASNISILTSSTKDQNSSEDVRWRHGAFTYLLLHAFRGDADEDGNRMLSFSELARYLEKNLPSLTNKAQSLGGDVKFFGDALVVAQ